MNRQEGFYWIKWEDTYQIAKYEIHQKPSGVSYSWYLCGVEGSLEDSDFQHINEVRIKQPGELPD